MNWIEKYSMSARLIWLERLAELYPSSLLASTKSVHRSRTSMMQLASIDIDWRLLAISLSPDYHIIALLCYAQIVSHLKYISELVLGAGQAVYTNQMYPFLTFWRWEIFSWHGNCFGILVEMETKYPFWGVSEKWRKGTKSQFSGM